MFIEYFKIGYFCVISICGLIISFFTLIHLFIENNK